MDVADRQRESVGGVEGHAGPLPRQQREDHRADLHLLGLSVAHQGLLDQARLVLEYGSLEVLRRYERWRRFDSFALAAATDALNRLFSNDFAPLRAVRDLGLGIVDGIGPLRRFFMRHAGGDIGKLPRLLRGEAA